MSRCEGAAYRPRDMTGLVAERNGIPLCPNPAPGLRRRPARVPSLNLPLNLARGIPLAEHTTDSASERVRMMWQRFTCASGLRAAAVLPRDARSAPRLDERLWAWQRDASGSERPSPPLWWLRTWWRAGVGCGALRRRGAARCSRATDLRYLPTRPRCGVVAAAASGPFRRLHPGLLQACRQ